MKKFLPVHLATALVALFVAYIGSALAAGLTYKSVESYLRTKQTVFQTSLTVAGDVTAGTNGVLGITTANAVTSYSLSAFSPPVSPCKVNLIFIDDATTPNTLGACNFTLVGLDQYGKPVRETVSSVGETAVQSERVYEKVTSVQSTSSCTAGGDAADYFRVACSDEYGVGMPISDEPQVTLCIYDDSADDIICYESGDSNFDGAVDIDDDAIDIGDLFTLAADDVVYIRVRSPAN